MPIRAVLLDIDGTLIDSNDAHAHAWVDAFAEAGVTVAFDQVRDLIGMGGDKLMPEVSGIEESTPEGQRLSERRKAIFLEKYLPTVKPLPGTRELLDHLQARGFKLVVATSAKSDELDALLRVAGASELKADATTSDDAERSKPDPDIVEAALGQAGCQSDEVLMLGDTPYDIEAAMMVGVAVIAFRSGGWDDEALWRALAIYDHPADLLAHFDDSPLVHTGPAKEQSP
jgi:HAD superfamily hydrolase (TIGR01549 family)